MRTLPFSWSRQLVALAVLSSASPAWALQPLDAFLKEGRTKNPELQEARGGRAQQEAQSTVALGRVLPGVNLRGVYTRNQVGIAFALPGQPGAPPNTVTIMPLNQWDGNATVTVPLIDLASFTRLSAANIGAEAAGKQEAAAVLQMQATVAQTYYQLLASLALADASKRALEVARTSLDLTKTRFSAGAAAKFDTDRAEAEVERQVQQLAAAELQAALAARALESQTDLTPDLETRPELTDDLHPEATLETFGKEDEEIPAIAAAVGARAAQERQATAARLALVPALSGAFNERLTNAPGLTQRSAFWSAQLVLNWNVDLTTFGNMQVADAGAVIAQARERRVRLQVRDTIHRAWSTVQTSIARSRSARAQEHVSKEAASLAQERYSVGAATQLDLLQAQREAFNAEAGRIQADADLVNARAQLRLAAGLSLLDSAG
jgi:outer membrane protein TolC